MSNDPFPVELEQIARRLAITPSLSQHDRRIVIDSLRRLAEIDATRRRHPSQMSPVVRPGSSRREWGRPQGG
jgi:hypothetical protein